MNKIILVGVICVTRAELLNGTNDDKVIEANLSRAEYSQMELL